MEQVFYALEGQAAGRSLFNDIQVPPANLENRIAHPVRFQLIHNLLFVITGELPGLRTLFIKCAGELIIV